MPDAETPTQEYCEMCGELATNGALCKKDFMLMCREQGIVTGAAKSYRDED